MMRQSPGCYTYPQKENKLHTKKSAKSVKECMAEYEIDNRTVYNILDQICKDTDLNPNVKHLKSKRNVRGASFAIHFRWLGLNQATTSEAELALQILMYDKKAGMELGKICCLTCQVPYYP